MPAIIIFIILALAVTFFRGPLGLKEVTQPETSQPKQTYQIPQKSYPQTGTEKEEKIEAPKGSTISVDTLIKYGPLEKEIIEETNKVLFEFRAKISPETKEQVSFETKMEGFDENWQETSSNEREIVLPPGIGEYTFFVRAKVKEVVDPTPAKRTFTIKTSPYFGKVEVSSITSPDFYRPSLITLYTRLGEKEKINLTGWQIKAKKGTFIIPQGVEKYNPFNPFFNEDIFIKANDTIYISGASSPFLVREGNFRPNKCLGYLLPSRIFTIRLSPNCPIPREDRLPRYLSETCRDYIIHRERCESINSKRLAEWDLLKDDACISYISANFTYLGCFSIYSGDEDFLERNWHIYMNKFEEEILGVPNDTIYLRDQNGLFLDKYSY